MMPKKEKEIETLDNMFLYNNPHPDAAKPTANEQTVSINAESEMEFNLMKPYPNHVFKLYTGKRFDDMVDSIRRLGILSPLLIWHKNDNLYVILSGHNRVNAGKIAGLAKGPVRILENLTEEEAALVVTETNLRQRSFADISHSERALSLAQHYNALKCQGKRNDLINEIETLINPHGDKADDTCSQVGNKKKTLDIVGDEYQLSKNTIARYIRLASLNSSLLAYVDTGEISFMAAYDLSFIEEKELQKIITDRIKSDNCKVDMKMAALMRSYYQKGKLSEETIGQIIYGEKTRKPKSKERINLYEPHIWHPTLTHDLSMVFKH